MGVEFKTRLTIFCGFASAFCCGFEFLVCRSSNERSNDWNLPTMAARDNGWVDCEVKEIECLGAWVIVKLRKL